LPTVPQGPPDCSIKPEDAAAMTVLPDVESSMRKLAETFAHGVAEG
jgi:hypothetical protein